MIAKEACQSGEKEFHCGIVKKHYFYVKRRENAFAKIPTTP
jgi:hypothetical protein